MIDQVEQGEWASAQAGLLRQPLGGAGFVEQLRADARDTLASQPLLGRKSERWRYSRADRVMQQQYAAPADDAVLDAVRLPALDVPLLDDAWRLVLFNGQLQPALSELDGLPAGVTLGSLHSALDKADLAAWLGQVAPIGDNLFTALNTGWLAQGMLLHVPAGVKLERPIQLVHVTDGAGTALLSQPRHLVVLEDGAEATLIEHYVGEGEYFLNHLSEIALGADAGLHHYRLQQEADAARHLSSLYLRQQSGSRYQGGTLSFGGNWARCDYNVNLEGEGADCDLFGLYLVGDGQLDDFHLDVRHLVPGCTSKERFKGIAWGKGRAVFDGRILVERQAQRTDAMLKNDNLMLSRDAEIDTKPQLEIYADDVKCGHGTTVGQIEPEQLFYLRSRGIPADAARGMLCEGFAGEVVERFAPEAVREQAYRRLSGGLAAAAGVAR